MEKGYRFTKIFFILGIIFALFLFFRSPSLVAYGVLIVIFTIVFGSIGWMIDMFVMKKPLFPIILIIIYLIVGGFYLNKEINTITCHACNFAPYENIFTGKCRTICDICGHHAPWYYRKNTDCIDKIQGMIGDMLRETRDYNRELSNDINLG